MSALLQESPAVEAVAPPERFVAQVGLRLARHPEQPATQRALEIGWRLVPPSLVGAWAFGQTVFVMAGVVLLGLRLGLGGDVAARFLPASQQGWLTEILNLSDVGLNDVGRIILQMLSSGGPLGWVATLNLALLVLIGLLYFSWLASWWARRQRHRLGVRNNIT